MTSTYNHRLSELNKMTLQLQSELHSALKEAQDANYAKTRFLARMSHEMRTPLNAVIGLSELMLNSGKIHGDSADKLDKIHIAGMTLLGIVNDILDISKIESGRFEMHPIEYDISSLINDIISLNTTRMNEKPIQFTLSVDSNLPSRLFGDNLRVKQVFNNLLSNAFKYTDSGFVKWNISFEHDCGDIWLISEIEDSGKGIKAEDIPKLFQDYMRVDTMANRETEGTGLGLSITKRLISAMDGTISVSSEYGKGSVFSVRMRQKIVSHEPIGTQTADNLMSHNYVKTKRTQSAGLVRPDLSYSRILVVDDMQTNLDIVKGMLMPYGIHVNCALSGSEAIEMIISENPRYDAVFMDHMMPGIDGVETVRIIREEIGTGYAQNIPIIALTANAIAGTEDMFLANGFQAYISKPVDIMRLDSVLRKWVRQKLFISKHFCDNMSNK